MNREIKFRGISVVTNEWVYGSLITDSEPVNGKYYEGHLRIVSIGEIPYQWVVVKNDSVGQMTGLKDLNLRDIYEGDIMEHTFIDDLDGLTSSFRFEVKLEDGDFWPWAEEIESHKSSVIGNIYQHPNLLTNNK